MTGISTDEEDFLYSRPGASIQDPSARGIPGLDELADVLEVPPGEGKGLYLMGISGNKYSLIALLTAHLLLMAEDIAKRESE